MNAPGFWQFSLGFYAEPGMAQACLQLQDSCGADVNVLLYLLYLARAGRRIDGAALERIDSLAREWRAAVVAPLRGVRTRIKTTVGAFEPATTGALRAEVQRVELAAERLQQETMERLAPAQDLGVPCADAAACARDNLALYADRLGGIPHEPVEIILARFVPAHGGA